MSKKYALVIFSDAQSESEESLGRVLNALVLANDLKERGEKIALFFQGAGTRSVNVLENPAHPGHGLYKSIHADIKGASNACATVFGADITTVPLLSEFEIPGIGGATSLAGYLAQGYEIITF